MDVPGVVSFWYVTGNKGVTFATNVLYNCWISDVMTWFKGDAHPPLPVAAAEGAWPRN